MLHYVKCIFSLWCHIIHWHFVGLDSASGLSAFWPLHTTQIRHYGASAFRRTFCSAFRSFGILGCTHDVTGSLVTAAIAVVPGPVSRRHRLSGDSGNIAVKVAWRLLATCWLVTIILSVHTAVWWLMNNSTLLCGIVDHTAVCIDKWSLITCRVHTFCLYTQLAVYIESVNHNWCG